MIETQPAPRRRGAVRSETARVAVLDATARLFAERGYDHMTIEGIAAAAGVAKQTIYRWWPSKSAVVAETLIDGRLLPGRFDVPDTGDVRTDLTAWATELYRFVDEPSSAPFVRSLLSASAGSVDIGARLDEALGATSLLTARVASAVASGELPADTPVHEVIEAIVGAVVLRCLRGAGPGQGDAANLVRVLLR